MNRHSGRWFGVLVAVLGIVMSGCAGSGPEVRTPAGPDAEGGGELLVANVAPGEHNSIGHVMVCVRGASQGKIVDVTTPDGSGVVISDLAVASLAENDIGGLRGRLVELGADTSNRAVSYVCPETESLEAGENGGSGRDENGPPPAGGDDSVEMLLIEVVAQGDKSAHADNLTVHWEADGAHGTFDYPLAITLCTTVDQDEFAPCVDDEEGID